jgi:dipeptidyl aminopeptidase/acylaminoacyl peptidase
MRKILLLTCVILTMITVKAQITGDWKGALSVSGMDLEVIFHISEEGGEYTTTLDVPMQGAAGIPMESTTYENEQLVISSSQMQMKYTAKPEGDSLSGTYEQMGMSLPLVLGKSESKLPGDLSLPSTEEQLKELAEYDKGNYKYSVEDYFSKPKASSFKISPNGKYMSYREKDENNKRHVYVKEIATGKVQRIIDEKEELIRTYGWINDERMIYIMDRGGDENYHLYATNMDGSKTIDLTPFEKVKADIINLLKDQKDYIIISMNKNNPQVFEPYKLNVKTGELEQLYENKDIANPIQDFIFDKDGALRGYNRLVNGIEQELYYKDLETGEFKLIKKMKWDETFDIRAFNYNSPEKDDAYVLTNLDSDKSRIVLYDLKENKMIKEVFSNSDYDVSGISLSRKRNYEIDFFNYMGEKSEITPVSDFFKKLNKRVTEEFKRYEYSIADHDDDENTFLLVIQSDKLYGTYYEYNVKDDKFTLLYDLMPQLKQDDMAGMRPITFKSRDGLTIHGYITLPKDALNGKKVPLVVNPHGGPQGVRDEWGFNPECQLFASRGYATLQVNFRISGGYGKEFLRTGFKQVGRKAMDDVEDGVRYAIEQGWIDADKIAIYGASHGGYATLMGLIKTPDLYACGIDYVGVSNIFTLFSSIPEYWKPYREMLNEIWYDLDNKEEAEIARQVSPALQVDKLNKPLFVIQGANDPRVNINESDQIVSKLRAKGVDVPYMVKYNEGHGFGHEENSMDMYKCTLGFLAKVFNQK